MSKNIIVHINDKIAEITLNRPERMNAITVDLLKELKDELININSNDAIAINTIPNSGIGIAINDRLKRACS